MKKQYIAPQMETYYIQSADSLLTTSNLVPVDGGGGIAGSLPVRSSSTIPTSYRATTT